MGGDVMGGDVMGGRRMWSESVSKVREKGRQGSDV